MHLHGMLTGKILNCCHQPVFICMYVCTYVRVWEKSSFIFQIQHYMYYKFCNFLKKLQSNIFCNQMHVYHVYHSLITDRITTFPLPSHRQVHDDVQKKIRKRKKSCEYFILFPISLFVALVAPVSRFDNLISEIIVEFCTIIIIFETTSA